MNRLLIVDDDPLFCATAARLLESHGYTVEQTNQLKEGLTSIQRPGVDLVLCGRCADGLEGEDLASCLRAHSVSALLPLIRLCSPGDVPQPDSKTSSPPDAWLARAVPEEKLVELVQTCLERRPLQDQTEPLEEGQVLGKREKLYRQLLDFQSEAVVLIDDQQRFVNVNPAAETLFAVEKGTLIGKRLEEFLDESAKRLVAHQIQLRRSGVRSTYEVEIINGRREPRQTLITAAPYYNDRGEARGSYAVIRDVTESKRAQRELAQEKILLRTLIDHMPLCVYAKDREGRRTISNPADVKLLGYASENAVLGKTDKELLPGEAAARSHAEDLLVVQSGQPVLDREELVDNGKEPGAWMLSSKLPLRNDCGQIVGLVGTAMDITQRRSTEAALRDALDKYQDLVESLSDWVWEIDLDGRYVYSSPRIHELLGYRAEEVLGRTYEMLMPQVEGKRVRGLVAEVTHRRQRHTRWETHYLHKAGDAVLLETSVLLLEDETGRPLGLRGVDHDITERRRAEHKLRQLSLAVEQSPSSVMVTDPTGRIEYVNSKFIELTGYSAGEVRGKTPRFMRSGLTPITVYADLWQTILAGREWRGDLCNKKRNGELFWETVFISPLTGPAGELSGFVAIRNDITAQRQAEKERSLMEVHLRQAQKLEAIGQLAAGIAHEINTPMQYVGDNTRFLQEAFQGVQQVLLAYKDVVAQAKSQSLNTESVAALEALCRKADLDYLFEQIPAALSESLDGIQRITKIVRAMKEFSHPGGKEKLAADFNKAIETTVTVARNEWKYVAEMKLDLAPDLPAVPCFVGEFSQVMLNLIINAAHAIGDVVTQKPGTKGTISISTRRQGEEVEVCVTDTGTGIPESVRPHIFEPFFTTKDVGKGTGQGLSIVYGVVVKKHGGQVRFETEVGKGTTFILQFPLDSRGSGTEREEDSKPSRLKAAAPETNEGLKP